MIIQLYGTNFINKGAELMLYAALKALVDLRPEVTIVSDLRCGTFRQRTAVGLQHLAWMYSKKYPFSETIVINLANLTPSYLRQMWRIVREQEVNVVLDASGFSYSDQLGPYAAELMATSSQRWKEQGKRIILLPQAFGPFETLRLKTAMSQVVENVDKIFARDQVSYEHLMSISKKTAHISIAPDFTCLVEGQLPKDFDSTVKRPCIIPNQRMIAETSSIVAKNYLPFLLRCANSLVGRGFEPFILVHETSQDYQLAMDLNTQLSKPLKIVREPDPLYLKGILGTCSLVISSRYHGLMSALSQGVPCIATGWSHKYQALLEDYGCTEYLLPLDGSIEQLDNMIETLIAGSTRIDVVNRLIKVSSKQKQMAHEMWQQVMGILND